MMVIVFVVLILIVTIWFQIHMANRLKSRAVSRLIGSIETFTYTGESGALSEHISKMSMEEHINVMIASGWEVVSQTGLPGHVRLGRTLTGAALTGGLSLLAGGSRTADRVTITYRRIKLIAPPSTSDVKSCAGCGTKCTSNSVFCAICGHKFLDGTVAPSAEAIRQTNQSPLRPGQKLCPACRGRCGGNSQYCGFCGHNFSKSVPLPDGVTVGHCNSCGSILPFGSQFCEGCGAPTRQQLANATSPSIKPLIVAAPSGSSSVDDLERLAALREKGLLSDSEFETAKRRLLGLPA